ncbi:hypothetical protein ABT336_18185 [Micromonospora sp. NPDC000207]|uniref:hypothetical protein n=1 Tax=Micromonospora sp. NPDC000207 TaxID=3154246 RepID=UPI003316809F
MIRRIRKTEPPPVSGSEIQAAEYEAARQRILDQAEAERTPLDDLTRAVRVGRRRDRP